MINFNSIKPFYYSKDSRSVLLQMFVTQRCSLANARRLKRAKGSAVRPSEIKTRLILTEGDEVVLDDLEQNMTLVK